MWTSRFAILKAVLPDLHEKLAALQKIFQQDGTDGVASVPEASDAVEDEIDECEEVEHRVVNESPAKKVKREEDNHDASGLFVSS